MKCSKFWLIVPGNQHFVGDLFAGSGGDSHGADKIDVERQGRAVLLDGAARNDAHLAELDPVGDLPPRQLLVTVFGARPAHINVLRMDCTRGICSRTHRPAALPHRSMRSGTPPPA